MNEVARACLVVAIAAVGLKTSPLEMKKVGGRAMVLLVVEALFLARHSSWWRSECSPSPLRRQRNSELCAGSTRSPSFPLNFQNCLAFGGGGKARGNPMIRLISGATAIATAVAAAPVLARKPIVSPRQEPVRAERAGTATIAGAQYVLPHLRRVHGRSRLHDQVISADAAPTRNEHEPYAVLGRDGGLHGAGVPGAGPDAATAARPAPPSAAPAAAAKTFSQQELDQLVAPIALYPDDLLAQVLMASTYPLEIVAGRALGEGQSRAEGQGAARTRCSSSRGIRA